MASTSSIIVAQTLPAQSTPQKAHARKHAPVALPTRRQCLLLLTATTALKAMEMPSRAQDIPLFGLRQGLRKAEQQAEEIVKEGFEAADKGIVAAEKGIEAAEKGVESAEKGIEAAEKEIKTAVSFGGLAQAGVVAGAEAVGVLIATSVVNGILGPEAQKCLISTKTKLPRQEELVVSFVILEEGGAERRWRRRAMAKARLQTIPASFSGSPTF